MDVLKNNTNVTDAEGKPHVLKAGLAIDGIERYGGGRAALRTTAGRFFVNNLEAVQIVDAAATDAAVMTDTIERAPDAPPLPSFEQLVGFVKELLEHYERLQAEYLELLERLTTLAKAVGPLLTPPAPEPVPPTVE